MPKTDFSEFTCSIARTVDVVGERWVALILRDVVLGVTRFDDMQRDLGVARNVLADRLDALVQDGILERRPYQDKPVRHDYLLTEKGRELATTLLALMAWGDRWAAGGDGPPVRLLHEACGEHTDPSLTCSCCGEPLRLDDLTAEAGPGGKVGPGTMVVGERLAAGPHRIARYSP
jgi:DNA-binding HxlR family transcriptional regulator